MNRLNDLLPTPPASSPKPKPEPKETLAQFKARFSL
jgi:hypothetical protein